MAIIDSLVSYWKMDEASGAALDAHGSNTLGENSGTIGSATGKINGGRDLEAGDTECFVVGAAVATTLPLSISVWFKAESLPVSKNANIMSAGIDGGNAFSWGLGINPSAKPIFYASNGSSAFVVITGGTTISVGSWYHFVVVWRSATDYQLYINGASEVTGSTSRFPSASQNIFVVGAYHQANSDPCDGVVDEMGVWGRDITADIAAIYNAGNGLAYPFGGPFPHYLRRARSMTGGMIAMGM